MFGSRRTHAARPVAARPARRSMFSRRRKVVAAPVATSHHHHHTTHTTHAAPVATTSRTGRRGMFGRRKVVHHQKRHATLGDKISGALMKLKGSIRGHPGEKAAGTRRMHGTDGRGSVRTTRRY